MSIVRKIFEMKLIANYILIYIFRLRFFVVVVLCCNRKKNEIIVNTIILRTSVFVLFLSKIRFNRSIKRKRERERF